jgi:hypothetical protein
MTTTVDSSHHGIDGAERVENRSLHHLNHSYKIGGP